MSRSSQMIRVQVARQTDSLLSGPPGKPNNCKGGAKRSSGQYGDSREHWTSHCIPLHLQNRVLLGPANPSVLNQNTGLAGFPMDKTLCTSATTQTHLLTPVCLSEHHALTFLHARFECQSLPQHLILGIGYCLCWLSSLPLPSQVSPCLYNLITQIGRAHV